MDRPDLTVECHRSISDKEIENVDIFYHDYSLFIADLFRELLNISIHFWYLEL